MKIFTAKWHNSLNILICCLFFSSCSFSNCQEKKNPESKSEQTAIFEPIAIATPDSLAWRHYLSHREAFVSFPLSKRVKKTALLFLQTPYVANTLENRDGEFLTLNLHQFDCTTFVENVAALSRTPSTLSQFQKNLQQIRYRDGQIKGYASRLHYFTDWIWDNEQKGLLKNVTQSLGGVERPVSFHFMSSHPNSYPALSDSHALQAIKDAEKRLNELKHFFIPQEKIASIESEVQNGDIIAITTNIDGLDVVHTGFAIQKNGRLHLLHASSKAGEVLVSSEPLASMLLANKVQTGIIVARLNDGITQ